MTKFEFFKSAKTVRYAFYSPAEGGLGHLRKKEGGRWSCFPLFTIVGRGPGARDLAADKTKAIVQEPA